MAVAGADMNQGAGRAASAPAADYHDDVATAWPGYIGFAAMMLVLIGSDHAVAVLVGIFKDGDYVVPKQDLLVTVDYTTWGWVRLVMGVLAIGTAIGMMAGQM